MKSDSPKGQNELRHAPRSALLTMRSGGSKPPPFLVHGIGGDVVSFSQLVSLLDAERPVYGFQQGPMGSGSEEGPVSLKEMATCYIEKLLAVQSGKPILLCGYSFGAIVGRRHPLLRRLVRRAVRPLPVSGRQGRRDGQAAAVVAAVRRVRRHYRRPGVRH